jgi:aryl-alcohol dehydrogenase-like predicted oxidoreductase
VSLSLSAYRTLGRSGLRVSPLCLGTMTFGQDWPWGADEATSVAILDRYAEGGGNFLDTANIYTRGHSEVILGNYFKARGNRDRFVVATKFGGNLYPGDPNQGGASRKCIQQSVEQSLRRLQTDCIDLYWMHFYDPHTPIEETMHALNDLVVAGKIRYIGFSDTPAWRCVESQMLARMRGWHPLIALQIEYSLIERSIENDLLPMAEAFGLGVTPWSPLRGGLLSGKYGRNRMPAEGDGRHLPNASKSLTDRNFSIIEALEDAASAIGAPMATLALAWVLQRKGVTSPIFGARTLAQFEKNLDALSLEIPAEVAAKLDAATQPPPLFSATVIKGLAHIMQGGTEVNGVPSGPWPLGPSNDQERW